MTRSLRAVAIGAALAIAATPFLGLTAATAAPGQAVLVFANGAVSDDNPGAEIDQTIAGLEANDATVTTFDGGDGSAAAWTAALTDIDVLVFPEAERGQPYYTPGGTAWISDDAVAVIAGWTEAGGDVILMGTILSNAPAVLLDALSGLDFSSVWAVDDGGTPLQLVDPTTGLPAELEYADGTYPIIDVDSWPAALTDGLTPIYLTADGTGLGIGRWTLGAGSFSYYAWDFFPWFDPSVPETLEVVEAWYAALGELLDLALGQVVEPEPEPAAAPELAATGFDAAGAVIAGALLLAGAALIVVRRRATVS